MTLKRILCVCMVLALVLAVTGCSSKDVQAQLDAANVSVAELQAKLDEANATIADLQAAVEAAEAEPLAAETEAAAEAAPSDSDAAAKIAELQALVDTYYPYYAAQIVATFGEDGVVWLKDVQEAYDSVSAQYASYGIDLVAYGMEGTVKKDLVNSAVEDAVIKAKAVELGLDQFDEAALAEFQASADAAMESYIDYYLGYYYPDAEEITDEMRAEAEKYWTDNGFSREAYAESEKNDAISAAVKDYVIKDIAVTDEDVQAEYETLIAENQESYANDRTYNSDRNANATIAWNPEGYRAVKHVLIKFSDEQSALYSDLQSQLDSLNAEKDAIIEAQTAAEATEAPTEETAEATEAPEAAEEAAEATEAPEDTEEAAEATEEPMRTLEEVNADIAACATEVEALYAQLMPEAEEVVAAFNAGASFDELISKYNDDSGMTSEPTATIGYAVSAESTTWDPAFTEGAMSIAEVGQISAPVRGSYGIHIIYYMGDITPGAVSLDEIRGSVTELALKDKQEAAYKDQVAAWVAEANVEYFYGNFGIAE